MMKKPRYPERRLSSTLPERLKNQTRSLHMQVERSAFMNTLLRSKMNRRSYVAMLRNLHAIYAALEAALARHAGDAAIAPIYEEALFRTEPPARDLQVLHGPGWPDAIGVQPACEAYVARLGQIADAGPADLLVAHAYVRYLGDLSGGQLLRRIVAESFHPPAGTGTSFYDFGDAARTAQLTAAFRAGLGEVSHDSERIEAIVGEAVAAFERHKALFDELAAACGVVSTSRASPLN